MYDFEWKKIFEISEDGGLLLAIQTTIYTQLLYPLSTPSSVVHSSKMPQSVPKYNRPGFSMMSVRRKEFVGLPASRYTHRSADSIFSPFHRPQS